MFRRFWIAVVAHRRLVTVTFEAFWILVFLLDRLGEGAVGGVPPFVYVNF